MERDKEKKNRMDVVSKFLRGEDLTKEQYAALLSLAGERKVRERLRREAARLRQKYYGNKVFIRGLIEFTNYCKNNCYYCGIRRDNGNIRRYRLSLPEITECCREGYQLGYRTFVLQGGEDPYFHEERVIEIIREIKKNHPDCAVTLSIGEKSKESYRRFREAGADRYLLRHETANERHYQSLHPKEMSLSRRKQCLYDLKELGYQVGAGFMVGAPGQNMENIAEDLLFLKDLQPEMVGIGPFIPHCDTRYAKESAGSVDLTVYLLSILRIMLPKALLPATTALGTMDERGREKGLLAGANVIMPNLSPEQNRKDYSLYDNKICMDEEAAQSIVSLKQKVESIGFRIVTERGDAAFSSVDREN